MYDKNNNENDNEATSRESHIHFREDANYLKIFQENADIKKANLAIHSVITVVRKMKFNLLPSSLFWNRDFLKKTW